MLSVSEQMLIHLTGTNGSFKCENTNDACVSEHGEAERILLRDVHAEELCDCKPERVLWHRFYSLQGRKR